MRSSTATGAADALLQPTRLLLVPPLAAHVVLVVGQVASSGAGGLLALVTGLPLAAIVGVLTVPPIAVAGSGRLRLAVVAVMTVVATVSAGFVVTSDDAQASLAILWVPFAAVPFAVATWVGRLVARRRPGPAPVVGERAASAEVRVAALLVDVVLVGTVLVWPLSTLSRDGHGVAAVVAGTAVAVGYLAGGVVVWGRSAGQALLGLRVAAVGGGRVTLPRAVVRATIVSLEVLVHPTVVLALPAAVELLLVVNTGHSLTDRLVGTVVLEEVRAAAPAGR
jgi:hypothetical protein